MNSAVAGTVLEVRFGLRNIGDLDADEVYLTLRAGQRFNHLPFRGEGNFA